MEASIRESIEKSRPELSASSVSSYVKLLSRIVKKLDDGEELITALKSKDKVMGYLQHLNFLTQRNYLNAIIVYLISIADQHPMPDVIQEYQSIRDDMNEQYNTQQSTRVPTAKQERQWVSLATLNEISDNLSKRAKELTGHHLDNNSLRALQLNFMLKFHLTHPLRNDLAHTIVTSPTSFAHLDRASIESSNYLVMSNKPYLSIGKYKTVKKYGVKIIELDTTVLPSLKKWLKYNPTRDQDPFYLLVKIPVHGHSYPPMNTMHITQAFNQFFDSAVGHPLSTTMIRHIVDTEKFGQQLTEMEEFADMMGHSWAQSVS